jgi:mono/diheme cytochrome c family protein
VSAIVRQRWLLVIGGPALLLLAGSVAGLVYLPHPIPRTATPAQRAYLAHCATCHGADGRGSWRSTIFLMRPGDLTDPRAMDQLSDDYLFNLLKNGGATIGQPGMPAFGFHLSDDEIRTLIGHMRKMAAPGGGRPAGSG